MPVNWDTGEILQAEKHKATAGQGKEPALFVDTVRFCCKWTLKKTEDEG